MKTVCLYLAFMLVPLYMEAQESYSVNSSEKTKRGTMGTRYLGDVNLDGTSDITDVICIVDYVLSKPLKVFAARNADMNGDGAIDISDAIVIVDYILGKRPSIISGSDDFSTDEVYIKAQEQTVGHQRGFSDQRRMLR